MENQKAEFVAKIPGGEELVFRSPDIKAWDRYVAKRRQGELSAARRELCAACCVSHPGSEVAEILAKKPAAPKVIAGELEEMAGADGDCVMDYENAKATFTTPDERVITMRAPTLEEWEAIDSIDIHPLDFSQRTREMVSLLCDGPVAGIFEQWPGIVLMLLDGAAALAGASVEIEVKKESSVGKQ